MNTALILINLSITIAVLIICLHERKGTKSAPQLHSRVGDNLSRLARRQEALQLATQKWHESVKLGLTFAERHEREVVVRLEREVAALENERFGIPEEATPKTETPKRQSEIKVDFINGVLSGDYYLATCSFCGWSATSSSMYTASARRDKHERKHV